MSPPQVSAHGTGATIPPVDEQVVSLRLVTPGQVRAPSLADAPACVGMCRKGGRRAGVVSRRERPLGERFRAPESHRMSRFSMPSHAVTRRRPPAARAGAEQGVLDLSADKDPHLFKLARVGLGMLGVVTELTLQVGENFALGLKRGRTGARGSPGAPAHELQPGVEAALRQGTVCGQRRPRKPVRCRVGPPARSHAPQAAPAARNCASPAPAPLPRVCRRPLPRRCRQSH